MKLKVVFMGSPDFAVPTLKALQAEFDVLGVITQPDKPTGRGRKLASSPVKTEADNLAIPCVQPQDLNDESLKNRLTEWMPDVIVVVAYGRMLPQWILDLPRMGCINVHASILPQHRGASPISTAIAQGDEITGVTTMMMDKGLDTGDMLLHATIKIDDRDTTASLSEKLMELGAELVVRTILGLGERSLERTSQDNTKATSTRLLTKKDGQIDWNRTAEEIDRFIRAMNPWPIAFFEFKGEAIKVWEAEPANGEAASGEVVEINRNGLTVGSGGGLIVLRQLQAPGKKKVAAFELASSKGIKPGDILNN